MVISVKDFKAKPARSTESAVEKAWVKTWKDLGIYSRHMSDAVPGLPDRYIRGGNWVEFKSLYRVRGEFTFGEGLSPEQIRCCDDLTKAGDSVFYVAQLDGWKHGKRYIYMPWRSLIVVMGQPIDDVEFTLPGTIEVREKLSRFLFLPETIEFTNG